MRVAVAQLAQLAEMRDTGRDMGPPPTEETAGEDSGPVASPLYLASFQACVLADTRLEPILVSHLFHSLLYASSCHTLLIR